MKKNGFIMSTYVYILLVFFLLLLGTMLVVLNNTRLLANKIKENTDGNIDFNLVLKGDKEIFIVKDSEYIEPGCIATTFDGEKLEVRVMGEANAKKSGEYDIEYSAEKKKASDKLLDKDEEITCKDVAKINDEDYASCKITFDSDGNAKVSITGKGKFDGLKITNGTKENAEVKEITKPTYGMKATEYITNLLEYDGEGLKIDNTPDQNIRYYGANPNNYVRFNNELWRIIGIFGNNVKLIRNDRLGWLSWDTSESTVNSGYGINQWGESKDTSGNIYEGADLQVYLNKMYYGGIEVTCYNDLNNTKTTCPKDSNGNFLELDDVAKNLIDNHTWNIGAMRYISRTNTLTFYQAERGSVHGK